MFAPFRRLSVLHIFNDCHHDLFDGARGVQLALLALESARAGCRLPVPPLDER